MKGTPAKETRSAKTAEDPGLSSKALEVNLEATDSAVTIDTKYIPLKEVVEGLPGLVQQTHALLRELNHPFKNWGYVVQEMRNYALRNLSVFADHPKAPQVVQIVFNEWLDAVALSTDRSVHARALENIIYFAEKIIDDARRRLGDWMPILSELFDRLADLPEEQFFLLASGYYQVKRLGQVAWELQDDEFDYAHLNHLLHRTFQTSYQYWLMQEDPVQWLVVDGEQPFSEADSQGLFQLISHVHLRKCMERLDQADQKRAPRYELKDLLQLPSYMDIVRSYKDLPNRIEQLENRAQQGPTNTLGSLLKIIEKRGLSSIHEDALSRLNRCLAAVIQTEDVENVKGLLGRTFDALKQSMQEFPGAALRALEHIGGEIFKSGDSDMVDLCIGHAIDWGFQCPDLRGTTTEWKVHVNPAHLTNIKVWLHLIENNPKWSQQLISALIINLKLAGLYIKDTDLFQKDVSLFIKSDVAPVYNLVKQLAKLFPVYFNEINAEGKLRDVSTEIDEVLNRQDLLIHFLRKQSHVESNNLLIDFTFAIIDFWCNKDKGPVRPYVPSELFDQIKETGPYVDGVNRVVNDLLERTGINEPRQLLNLDQAALSNHLSAVPGTLEPDKKRVLLLISFLKLLDQKYNLTHLETRRLKNEAALKGLPNTERLEKALENTDLFSRIQGILDYLKLLKQIILSPKQFEISEDIYRKRHIAADIPSMYGTYHEPKFDALGFTFRLENLANVLFEELIGSINLEFLTRTTFFQIADCMHLLVQAMELDGIVVKPLRDCLNLLIHAIEVRRFSFTQYLDIFREFSRAEQQILTTHYTSIHKENLGAIIRKLGPERLLPKYSIREGEEISGEVVGKVSETFFRDIVATTFGFQYLDNFVGKVTPTLSRQSEELTGENLDLLLSYDPGRSVSELQRPLRLTKDPISLGGKGHNLVRLAALKMPVPGGFIITTEVFRCLRAIRAFKQADDDLREKILFHVRRLEKDTNRRFGDPNNPLLVSVRSGAAISLPGMMITFLDVGLNETVVEGLIKRTGKPWFVWDNYRRFLQSWGMSYNMERDVFDDLINDYKVKCGVKRKRQFTPDEMRALAFAYRQALTEAGVRLADDPYEQLFQAIRQVFYSWSSNKAKTYRDIMGLSDDWGTAVIVQNMVYGNLHEQAGSGVVFTHNPHASLDRVMLWGDYTTFNQGEDVVSGLVRTDSISLEQQEAEDRDQDSPLEEAFPQIFAAMKDVAKRLVYEEGWSAQEIEFTFEGPTADKLYLLQSRDMVIRHRKRYPTFVPSSQLRKDLLTKGIGVTGGAISGRAVFSLEDISRFRSQEPDTLLILIRFDTVPDDIREISAADGLLTSRGGTTSHASIVAHQLGKTCVVGCSSLTVYEKAGYGVINGSTIRCGDLLSIDGRNGFVYKGRHETTA
jgi:pyruvate,orthophosphate dikinase